ncbi:MAG: hypothetical protein LC774_05350 [Acidobacteria bacterium]|nr:hypothetical protein [Acidobacteriota bacterium]
MQFQPNPRRARARRLACNTALVLVFTGCASPQTKTQANSQNAPAPQAAKPAQPAQAAQPRTPSDTVREFSRALRERRFRDAFALTVLKPAIEQMNAEEFEDMRPEIEKLVPALREDVESVATMGYRLSLTLASDARSYKVNAEPARYGHTGRLSFYMDATGRQEKDNGGKPFNPPPLKKKKK